MGAVKTIFGREPVLWQTAVLAVINLLVVFKFIEWTAVQIGTVNAVVAAVLGLIVRSVVTPLADPNKSVNGVKVPLVLEPAALAEAMKA